MAAVVVVTVCLPVLDIPTVDFRSVVSDSISGIVSVCVDSIVVVLHGVSSQE